MSILPKLTTTDYLNCPTDEELARDGLKNISLDRLLVYSQIAYEKQAAQKLLSTHAELLIDDALEGEIL